LYPSISVSQTQLQSHDETLFSDPFAFRPERFLVEESPLPDPSTIAFGWGRRYIPQSNQA
jgi:cytochrome P450